MAGKKRKRKDRLKKGDAVLVTTEDGQVHDGVVVGFPETARVQLRDPAGTQLVVESDAKGLERPSYRKKP